MWPVMWLKKKADSMSFHPLGSEKADFITPFVNIFEVYANALKLQLVKCAI